MKVIYSKRKNGNIYTQPEFYLNDTGSSLANWIEENYTGYRVFVVFGWGTKHIDYTMRKLESETFSVWLKSDKFILNVQGTWEALTDSLLTLYRRGLVEQWSLTDVCKFTRDCEENEEDEEDGY